LRITTNQADAKPNPNNFRNPTTKHHEAVSIQRKIVKCREKFIQDSVIARFLLLSVVIVTLPCGTPCHWKTSDQSQILQVSTQDALVLPSVV